MKTIFTFDQNDYEFVRDHCPEDHPVLPFVSAVDAFYTTLQQHVGPCVLQDIRLVKGIILQGFKTFEMMIEIDEDKQTVQLIGENGVVHYKAAYEKTSVFPGVTDSWAQSLEAVSTGIQEENTGSRMPSKTKALATQCSGLPSFAKLREDRSMTSLIMGDYDFLFHGPMLRSIVSIQTDAQGKEATGVLKTAAGMGRAKTDWFFDPFACDGALQMGCQLAFMAKQKASLPSKIKRAVFYKKAVGPRLPEDDLTVFVHLIFQKMSGLQYIFDAHLFDKNNEPVCSLESVESYFRLFK